MEFGKPRVTNRCLRHKSLKIHKELSNAWKNTNPVVLHSASIFLSLKNELKLFPSRDTHEKGGPALKWSLLETTTYMANEAQLKAIYKHMLLQTNKETRP